MSGCMLCGNTVSLHFSVGGVDALKIEEMEKMLKEAQLEKARLIESRVRHDPYLMMEESSCSSPHPPTNPRR